MFREYEKIFYMKDGRDFNFCDCYGICYLFNKENLNKEIPKYVGEDIYSSTGIKNTFNKLKKDWKEIPRGKESVGDIISLEMKHLPVHVGVVVKKGAMLHIMENRHAAIESYNSIKWKNKINSFWRYESIK